jgi:perosamine synthetase
LEARMTERNIPFGKPMLDDSERNAVAAVLSGTTLVHGPVSKEFEAEFAARAGVKHAVSLSSCTAGLHLSLFVRGIGPGDTVIVPAMTHVATAHAVEFCGARPIFVDVDPLSGNIDPTGVEAAFREDTRAAMVVHYLGLPCDMARINAAADKADAVVIEDCALAVDATYDGIKAGGLGLTGCFSFYPVKHITSVEGGIVTTNDDAMAAAIAKRKAFGYDRMLGQRIKPGVYDVDELGYNYRMSEVHAAVGLAQLRKLDAFQAARAENFQRLQAVLADVEEITVFDAQQGKSKSSHYCLNAILPRDGSIARDDIVSYLKERGVGTSVHYPKAVPSMSYYAERYGYTEGSYPVAEWLADATISLPVGPHLNDGDAEWIGNTLKDAVFKVRR